MRGSSTEYLCHATELVGSEKYRHKLLWLQRLRKFLETMFKPTDPLIICGDFNVAHDEKDVGRPEGSGSRRTGSRCRRRRRSTSSYR